MKSPVCDSSARSLRVRLLVFCIAHMHLHAAQSAYCRVMFACAGCSGINMASESFHLSIPCRSWTLARLITLSIESIIITIIIISIICGRCACSFSVNLWLDRQTKGLCAGAGSRAFIVNQHTFLYVCVYPRFQQWANCLFSCIWLPFGSHKFHRHRLLCIFTRIERCSLAAVPQRE